MIIDLTDTTASKVAAALVQARRHAGSPAMGMVLTLIVVADEDCQSEALAAAGEAAREHPCRIIGVILHKGRGDARLDAEVRVGADGGPGEDLLLRMYGPLTRHAASVVTPLLLPESPIVVWWPASAPAVPSEDPIGSLGQRRVTDANESGRSLSALLRRAGHYAEGDTDLAWTRTTPWRTLLASSLDRADVTVTGAVVEAERGNPTAELLAAWLAGRLGVEVTVRRSDGPGITAAVLQTDSGDMAITRPDGRLARYSVPGQPHRHVALNRRSTSELLAEELRWLDPDDIYAQTIEELRRRRAAANGPSGGKTGARSGSKSGSKTGAKTAGGKATARSGGRAGRGGRSRGGTPAAAPAEGRS